MLRLAKDLRAQLLAHAIARDHLAGQLGGALEVVARTSGDVVAEELLGRAAGEQHGNLVEHAIARLEEVVLLGHLHGVAKGLAAAHDRDLVHRVGVLEHVADKCMAALVERNDAALLLGDYTALALGAGDHALHGLLNLVLADLLLVPARGEKRGLVHEVCEVCAGEARRDLGDCGKVHRAVKGLVARVHAQDLLAALDVRAVHGHATVKAAGTQQCRVENVRAVGCGNENDGRVVLEAVHLYQQLVQGLLALVVATSQAGSALTSHGVDLVDEDDAGRGCLGLLEEVAHAACSHAHEHLHEVRAGYREERHARLASHGLGKQRLARARGPHKKHAVRNLCAHLLVALGLAQEVAYLFELFHRLVDARDVGELDLGTLLFGGLRLGLGEVHRAAVLLAHAAHVVHKDAHEKQRGHNREQDGLPGAAVRGVDGERRLGVLGHELFQRVRAHVVALELLELGLVAQVILARPVVTRDAAVRGLERDRVHAVVLDRGHELVGCQRVHGIRGGKRTLAGGEGQIRHDRHNDEQRHQEAALVLRAAVVTSRRGELVERVVV